MGHALWLPSGNVVKDQVVELMLEHPSFLFVTQLLKEVWIVSHFKMTTVWIDTDTRSRDSVVLLLFDLATESSKEWLFNQQAISMEFQIKAHLLSLTIYSTILQLYVKETTLFICP